MTAIFPFCQSDLVDEERLQNWIAELGGCPNHHALVIADGDVQWSDALRMRELAEQSFKSVTLIIDEPHFAGWIFGGNSKFKRAAMWAKENGVDFYFNEPDNIPLRHGWMDEIEAEYKTCGKPFMGTLIAHGHAHLPQNYLEGNSVYPSNAWDIIEPVWKEHISWPMAIADTVRDLSHNSKLLYHFYGEMAEPPVFSEKGVSGTRVFSLAKIPPEAVTFHRSKGGSLIRLLQHKRGISKPITVVFPVCPNDIGLAVRHAHWLHQMQRKWAHNAIITFDASIDIPTLNDFRNILEQCFVQVDLFKYPMPPVLQWPNAPNWAWQQTARYMAGQNHPWFWFEADCVALTPDWLDKLNDEYHTCGRSWCGPIVKGMGHVNGGCIYPPDAALRSPIAMSCTGVAWDYAMKNEMVFDCHDASHLMQHTWTILNDEAIETGGGETPCNVTLDRAKRWIRKGAVCIHRIKDSSLVALLASGQFKP